MIQFALNTGFHILMGITIFIALSMELFLLKPKLSYQQVRTLAIIDSCYGISAIMVLSSGLLNWMSYGKGFQYYLDNTFFIAKLSAFLLVGLLSIYPTVSFLRTRASYKASQPQVIVIKNHAVIKKIIIVELALMAVIPFLAVLMANGINF